MKTIIIRGQTIIHLDIIKKEGATMGLMEKIFGGRRTPAEINIPIINKEPEERKIAAVLQGDEDIHNVFTYASLNKTFNGDLTAIDINALLSNPQNEQAMHLIFRMCRYYSTADAVIRAIIFNTYLPYLTGSRWYLKSSNKKTNEIFKRYYDKIRLDEKIESILTELCIYGQCFVYIYNGVPITLNHDKCKIGNTSLNGKPIILYNIAGLKQEPETEYAVYKEFVPDSDKNYSIKGFPPEIQEAVETGSVYAQMNPKYCFCIQLPKASYEKYSIPWIATALPALKKKQLISEYETAQLEVGKLYAVHVKVGDTKKDTEVNRDLLSSVKRAFINGFKRGGSGLITTHQFVDAQIINQPIGTLYQYPIYESVNNEILAAGGIASVIATGVATNGGTYASAASGEKALESRLEIMRRELEELITNLNKVFVEFMDERYNLKSIPEFKFEPISIAGKAKLREECLTLYDKGLVSKKTVDNAFGYDYEDEIESIKFESDKIDKTKIKESKDNVGDMGRPVLDNTERMSPESDGQSGNPQSKL